MYFKNSKRNQRNQKQNQTKSVLKKEGLAPPGLQVRTPAHSLGVTWAFSQNGGFCFKVAGFPMDCEDTWIS